jgi:hypothetical protein
MFTYSMNKPPDPTKYDKMHYREWKECDAMSSIDGYQYFGAAVFQEHISFIIKLTNIILIIICCIFYFPSLHFQCKSSTTIT